MRDLQLVVRPLRERQSSRNRKKKKKNFLVRWNKKINESSCLYRPTYYLWPAACVCIQTHLCVSHTSLNSSSSHSFFVLYVWCGVRPIHLFETPQTGPFGNLDPFARMIYIPTCRNWKFTSYEHLPTISPEFLFTYIHVENHKSRFVFLRGILISRRTRTHAESLPLVFRIPFNTPRK